MLKKFFNSAVPAVVALSIGAIVFVIGNFFGNLLPETWLTPMAWVSSGAFCVGLVLAAVAYGVNVQPFGMTFPSVLLIGGGMLALLWLLMEVFGIVNEDFVDITIFRHPAMGGLSFGLLLMGLFAVKAVFKKDENPWRRIYVALCGLFLISFGVIFAGELWILPIGEKAVEIIGLIACVSFAGMLGMIILAVLSKKLNYL